MSRADRHKMQLQVEYVDISTIKPYKGNAKEHPKEQIEQIKKSITELGNLDPIGIWHNEIVEGHGRYEALKQLGYTDRKRHFKKVWIFYCVAIYKRFRKWYSRDRQKA